jgi:hypothetical protein
MTFPLGTLYHGGKSAVEGFNGRSFEFTNDESLVEYQDVALGPGYAPILERGTHPLEVDEVINTAAAMARTGSVMSQEQMRKCCWTDVRRKMTHISQGNQEAVRALNWAGPGAAKAGSAGGQLRHER